MVHDFDTSFKIIFSSKKNDETIRIQNKYDPELARFTRQHIYGEGVMDVFKNIGSKLFGKTMKKAAKTAATKVVIQQQPQKLVNMLERKLVIK